MWVMFSLFETVLTFKSRQNTTELHKKSSNWMGASATSPKVAVRPKKDYSDIEVYRVNVKLAG